MREKGKKSSQKISKIKNSPRISDISAKLIKARVPALNN